MKRRLTQRSALRGLSMLSVLALMTLTSCGFQLKGTGSNTTQLHGLAIRLVSGQPRAELRREVTRELAANGLVLRDDPDTDLSLRLGQRNLLSATSLSPRRRGQRNLNSHCRRPLALQNRIRSPLAHVPASTDKCSTTHATWWARPRNCVCYGRRCAGIWRRKSFAE